MTVTTTPATQEFFNGTGSQTSFTFNFTNSFEDDDALVYVWNTTTSKWDLKEKDTDYSQTGTIISFFTAPETGTGNVMITRKTDVVDPKVDYQPGSSVRAQDLDNNQRQVIQRLQELENQLLNNSSAKLHGNLDLNNYNIVNGDQVFANLHVSNTPPENPTNGTRWFDTESGRTYIYYTDVDSSDWVDTTPTYVQVGTSDEALPLAGGTMTGFITLHSNPTSSMHAATKSYVDTATSSGLSDGDKGDITVASSGTSWTIDDNAVDAAAIADNAVGTDQLAGIAKGGLIHGNDSGDPAVLTVGSNGEVLKTNSSGQIEWGSVTGNGTVTQIGATSNGGLRTNTGSDFTTSGTLGIDVNAKGDLVVGTADNTVTNLTAGANGKVLTADSGEASGLKWADASTTIADNSVTGAKIALSGQAHGDVMYYNGTDWVVLGAGTTNHFLQTKGVDADPVWASASAANTFTAAYKKQGENTSSTGVITTRTIDSKLEDFLSVKDFGATGDGTTDDTTAIQNAIDNNPNKPVYFPKGTYRITSSLIIDSTREGIRGEGPYSIISLDVTSNTSQRTPAIILKAPDNTNTSEFVRIENLHIKRGTLSGSDWTYTSAPPFPTTPGKDDAGVSIQGADYYGPGGVDRAVIQDLRIGGFSTGMYFNNVVGLSVNRVFVQQYAVYAESGSITGNSGKYCIGFHFDGTPFADNSMSPLASIEVTECEVDNTGVSNSGGNTNDTKSIGYYLYGKDLRDIFLNGVETSKGKFGIYAESSNTDWNWNIHITRPIIDGFTQAGIHLQGLGGAGSTTINDGYLVGSGDCLWVEDCKGVVITGGTQFLKSGSAHSGVRLKNSSYCSILGNRFSNIAYPISLDGSTYNVASGNVINAHSTADNSSPTLVDAIRLFNNASYNVIGSNIVSGQSSGNQYTYWANVASGSNGNRFDSNKGQYTGLRNDNGTDNKWGSASIDDIVSFTGTLPSGNNFYTFTDENDSGMKRVTTNELALFLDGTAGITLKKAGEQGNHEGLFVNTTDSMTNSTGYMHHINGGVAIKSGNGTNISITDSGKNQRGRIGHASGGSSGDVIFSSNSDYRLKENISPMKDGLERLKNLKPCYFSWKTDEEHKLNDGFIAHEVQEVVPNAVLGEKDGEEMQTLDPAKLVPVLTSAIKELTSRLEALEAK